MLDIARGYTEPADRENPHKIPKDIAPQYLAMSRPMFDRMVRPTLERHWYNTDTDHLGRECWTRKALQDWLEAYKAKHGRVNPKYAAQRAQEAAERAAADKARRESEFAADREAWRQSRRAVWTFHANKRRAAKLQRTPPWVDMEAIRALYDEASRLTRTTGVPHHVDHEIPLQGTLVSGLHVHTNMRVIPASENVRKYNFFEVE